MADNWKERAKRRIERYFLTRKTGRVSWKKEKEEFERLGYDWDLEKKRRQKYGKYIQKQRNKKYCQIKKEMDKLKKTVWEEEEVESDGKKWIEYRRRHLKLVWNNVLQKLQWVEDWKERKVNKFTWKKH